MTSEGWCTIKTMRKLRKAINLIFIIIRKNRQSRRGAFGDLDWNNQVGYLLVPYRIVREYRLPKKDGKEHKAQQYWAEKMYQQMLQGHEKAPPTNWQSKRSGRIVLADTPCVEAVFGRLNTSIEILLSQPVKLHYSAFPYSTIASCWWCWLRNDYINMMAQATLMLLTGRRPFLLLLAEHPCNQHFLKRVLWTSQMTPRLRPDLLTYGEEQTSIFV